MAFGHNDYNHKKKLEFVDYLQEAMEFIHDQEHIIDRLAFFSNMLKTHNERYVLDFITNKYANLHPNDIGWKVPSKYFAMLYHTKAYSYRLKDGAAPYEAIQHIIENDDTIIIDCGQAIILALQIASLRFLQNLYGKYTAKAKFNSLFKGLTIANISYTNDPIIKLFYSENKIENKIFEITRFKNPQPDLYNKKHSEGGLNRLNTIRIRKNAYIGFDFKGEKSRKELYNYIIEKTKLPPCDGENILKLWRNIPPKFNNQHVINVKMSMRMERTLPLPKQQPLPYAEWKKGFSTTYLDFNRFKQIASTLLPREKSLIFDSSFKTQFVNGMHNVKFNDVKAVALKFVE